MELRDLGNWCSKNRVARLMAEKCLRARQKRRFRPATTDSKHSDQIARNWLAKVRTPDHPGQNLAERNHLLDSAEGWLTSTSPSTPCLAPAFRTVAAKAPPRPWSSNTSKPSANMSPPRTRTLQPQLTNQSPARFFEEGPPREQTFTAPTARSLRRQTLQIRDYPGSPMHCRGRAMSRPRQR